MEEREKRVNVKKLEKVFTVIGNVMSYIAVAALIVMVVITILDVFLKNVFKAPIPGALEITRMMMVCMSPAFVSVLMHNRHVRVGLIVDRLSRRGQLVFDTVGYTLSAALCGLMCYQGFVMVARRMAEKQVYTSLKIPTWPFYLIFTISIGMFAVAIVAKLLINIMDKDVYAKPPQPEEIASEGMTLEGGEEK